MRDLDRGIVAAALETMQVAFAAAIDRMKVSPDPVPVVLVLSACTPVAVLQQPVVLL